MTPIEQKIIDEFDKKFEYGNENPALIGKGDAKDFILNAMNQAKQEAYKDCFDSSNIVFSDSQKQSIIQRLEGIRKDCLYLKELTSVENDIKSNREKSYNQAITDAINVIKEM